jgi:hypothetical protein
VQGANAATLIPSVQDKPRPIASIYAVSQLSRPGGRLVLLVVMGSAGVLWDLNARVAVTDRKFQAATRIGDREP